VTDYGFTRVSSGSQDAATQRTTILRAFPGAQIISMAGGSASASKGEHLDVLESLIAKLTTGDRVIVTDSSRLDRRDNLTNQIQTMLAIRQAGAIVVSLAPGEETFGTGDDLGSWIATIVKQSANAEKSRVVKTQTWRGVEEIIRNHAHFGPLPKFWTAKGTRYGKKAVCTNPEAVQGIYARIAKGESVASVARMYDMWPVPLRILIRWKPNMSGVVEESYTYEGETREWTHAVTPVVEASLWWQANQALDENRSGKGSQKGGRPVKAGSWISGLLECPKCGGKAFVTTGKTAIGNPRTPMLRCGGLGKNRVSCGQFRGANANAIQGMLEEFFASLDRPVLAYQRITGNRHELQELEASLAALQASLSRLEGDGELEQALADRKALRAQINSFELVPDTYDYAETGETISGMWESADPGQADGLEQRRAMIQAVKNAGSIVLMPQADGSWGIRVILITRREGEPIIDLGGGLCFRGDETSVIGRVIESLE